MTALTARPRLRPALALAVVVLCAGVGARTGAAEQSRADANRGASPDAVQGLPATDRAPKFLFSEQPSILILIDGEPVYRGLPGTDLERLVNTMPFIVRDTAGIHYLKVLDGWMEAYILTGSWSVAGVPPDGGEQALRQATAAGTVDLLQGAYPGQPRPTPTLDADQAPVVFISTPPAELIITDGPPRFATVAGTPLEYIENTSAHVFREPTDQELYVLSAGRWFSAWTTDGPWEFVPVSELPADIAAIQATLRK
jgi:hypothetical protein